MGVGVRITRDGDVDAVNKRAQTTTISGADNALEPEIQVEALHVRTAVAGVRVLRIPSTALWLLRA